MCLPYHRRFDEDGAKMWMVEILIRCCSGSVRPYHVDFDKDKDKDRDEQRLLSERKRSAKQHIDGPAVRI